MGEKVTPVCCVQCQSEQTESAPTTARAVPIQLIPIDTSHPRQASLCYRINCCPCLSYGRNQHDAIKTSSGQRQLDATSRFV